MWQQIVKDIRQEGWTFQKIGDYCGLQRNSIHEIGTGATKEPKGEAAIKLQRLHKRLMRARAKVSVSHE